MAKEVKDIRGRCVKELKLKCLVPHLFFFFLVLYLQKNQAFFELSCEHIYQSVVNKHGHLILESPATCFVFLI